MLNERTHGPLLTGIALLTEMCYQHPELIEDIRSVCFFFKKKKQFFLIFLGRSYACTSLEKFIYTRL